MGESNPIQMNESAFQQFVANIQSANVQKKFMPALKLSESASERTVLAEEMQPQLLHYKQTTKAMRFHSIPVKGATTATENEVTSSETSEEGSQEIALAQELVLAKASGIDSTYVECCPAVKNPSSQHEVCNDLDIDRNNTVRFVGSPLHAELVGTLENILNEDPEFRISVVEQSKNVATDTSSADNVQQNHAGNDQIFSSVVDDCSAQQTFSKTAPVPDGIGSQTSEQYFSATSATLNGEERTYDQASVISVESIEIHIGSDSFHSESEYSAPWEGSYPHSPSTMATEGIPVSEGTALITEDFVPASDFAAFATEGEEEIHDEFTVIIEDAGSEYDDDGLPPPFVVPNEEEEFISLQNASSVLMQEESSDEELSSDGV